MQRVHFIAIGGDSILNLAIAVSRKSNFKVTGSDDAISETPLNRLKERGLLPDKMGWYPERIHSSLQAIILGSNVTEDNPELVRAKELGLKIYSVPEFIFQQTRSKTRIVVAGSQGKTITTAIILFVLKQLKFDADYLIEGDIVGYENKVKLSFESRVAVFEGDEFVTSITDSRPKFQFYKPHIAAITGISWLKSSGYESSAKYLDQFATFTQLMEVQGRLIFLESDENIRLITKNLRRDIVPFPYQTPQFKIVDGTTFLITKKEDVPLKIYGDENLQYLTAARLVCRQIGVSDEQFYNLIPGFQGI